MVVQKIYKWFCIVSWSLWILAFILTAISGDCFDVKNEELFEFVRVFSGILFLISLIPIHPVLWVCASVYSTAKKNWGYSIFNVISFIVTLVLWFFFFVNHTVSLMGGV